MKSSARIWLAVGVIGLLVLMGCAQRVMPNAAAPTVSPSVTPAASPVSQPSETSATSGATNASGLSVVATVVSSVPTRTPIPAPTPDAVLQGVLEIVPESGRSDNTFLWVPVADWLNLLISLLYVAAAYLIGTWLIRVVFPRLVRLTKMPLDDRLLNVAGNQLRWIAVVLMLQFATNRLNLFPELKTLLLDLYFFLLLFFVTVILWRLTDLGAEWIGAQAKRAGNGETAKSLILLAVWLLRLGIVVLALTRTLSHFGVNITGFAIFLGIVALVLSLASRDIVADIISGVIILIDRPFRVGDQIELSSLASAGSVYEIGVRYTQVLTLDNRMVILPNSQLARNQIVNCSYPDPSIYDSTNVLVAYENDVARVHRLIAETVRGVEGVKRERAIDVVLVEMTESHLRYNVGWWLASYTETMLVRDRINITLITALQAADIVLPYHRRKVTVELNRNEGPGEKEVYGD